MKIRFTHFLPTLAIFAACGTTTTSTDNQVVEVRVSPEGATTNVGLSVQFTAEGLNSSGDVVSGLPVTWEVSAPDVATIDNAGAATAITAGQSMVTATIGSVSDTETFVVEASVCTNRVDVVLAPGEFQAYDGTQCLLLPAGQDGDRYRVAVARPTLIADSLDVPNVTLRIDPVLSATAAPIAVPPQSASPAQARATGPLPRIDGSRIVQDLERMNGTRRFHHELRAREQQLGLDRSDALPDLSVGGPARTSHPDPPTWTSMYLGLDCGAPPVQRRVRLIGFDEALAIYQDSIQWAATPLTQAATDQMLSYYSNYSQAMISDYFGDPSDIDGNGRIIVVTTPSLPSNAAAAVYSGDFLTTASAPGACPTSNEAEVVYFAQDVISDLVDPTDPSYLALSVLAHEVKHVVSVYNGMQRGSFHDTWMEEGRAEIAQAMSSRIAWAATGGPPVGSEITGQDILDGLVGGEITPEMWAVVVQAADLTFTLGAQPNSLVTNPSGSASSHSFYASSFHFHRFLGDSYGNAASPGADAALFAQLAAQTSNSGASGLAQATGKGFDALFEELVVATSTHGEVQSPARAFSTWDFQTVTDIFQTPNPDGLYPWPVTHTGGSTGNPNAGFVSNTFSGPIGPSGVRFHDFESAGVGVGAEVLVTGAATGRIIVTRLN